MDSRLKPSPRTLLYPALILLAFLALVILVNPFHDYPVQDDWDYARTVAMLLKTGAFERSQIAQASEVASALWGALFAVLFGFSFNTLRFSTLVLSAASLLIFYATLGALVHGASDCEGRRAARKIRRRLRVGRLDALRPEHDAHRARAPDFEKRVSILRETILLKRRI